MNTEINLYRPIFTGEAAQTGQGPPNTVQGLTGEISPFQLLLFQSLGQVPQREMADYIGETEENGVKEFLEGMSGLLLAGQAPAPAIIAEESGEWAQGSDAPIQAPTIAAEAASVEEADQVQQRGGPGAGMPAGFEAVKTGAADSGIGMESLHEEKPLEGIKNGKEAEALKPSTGPELTAKEPGAGREASGPPKNPDSLKEPLRAESGRIAETESGMEKIKTPREFRNLPVHGAAAPQNAELREPPVKAPEKLEAYSQIGREIQLKLEQKGPMEFKMQLEPKDLGQIDIKMKISEGKLIIDIMAASSKTQALLAGQADKLVMSMGLQNVKVESVQVNPQDDQQSGERQGQAFLMNGETNFSDGRQHGRLSQQSENRQSRAAVGGRYEAAEISGVESAGQGGVLRSNFVRMDYSI